MDAQPAQLYLGPIKLAPGVTPREVILFLMVVAIAGVMVSYIALMQPFVYSDVLHIPAKAQGRIGGTLAAVEQTMLLLFISLAGALADRWGRKTMLLLALTGFTISAFLFPLLISVPALFLLRAFLGLAKNGHTAGGPTKMFDYPDNDSRGKFMALTMIFLNLSSLLLVQLIGARLLTWLHAAGLTPHNAGVTAFWILAAVGVLGILICAFGLKPDHHFRPPPGKTRGLKGFLNGFVEVYRYAMTNPAFALIMITGFVIRTDQTVLLTFLSLWVVHSGGMDMATSIKTAGLLGLLQQGAFLIVPPLFGYFLDRTNRRLMYTGAMGFAGLALISTVFVHNVTSWPIFVVMGLIGLGESAQTITQQAFFGQEAPPHLRGTAYGVFAFTGTFSVVIISFVSGQLFDKVGPTAPFILAGVLHLVFLAMGLAFMKLRGARFLEQAGA
jgi:MFS family permease